MEGRAYHIEVHLFVNAHFLFSFSTELFFFNFRKPLYRTRTITPHDDMTLFNGTGSQIFSIKYISNILNAYYILFNHRDLFLKLCESIWICRITIVTCVFITFFVLIPLLITFLTFSGVRFRNILHSFTTSL